MKNFFTIFKNVYFSLFSVLLFSSFFLLTNEAVAQNSVHPKIILRDANNRPLRSAAQEMSPQTSCANCHDSAWIQSHNTHNNENVQVNCVSCHFEKGKLPANLSTANTKISRPKTENCAACHGVVHESNGRFAIPQDYEKVFQQDKTAGNRYGATQLGGAIFSPQFYSSSGLNLKDKNNLNFPFDAHASARLSCVSCHYTKNSPAHQNKKESLDFLKFDPRQVSLKNYLNRPDHRLQTSNCTDCHDPMVGHKNLPRKKRHLASVECQSCHIPVVYGPAFRAVDETVSKADGSPLIEYRNAQSRKDGQPFSTMFQNGYHPFLSAEKGKTKVAPFNFTAWYFWQDKAGKGKEEKENKIPFAEVQAAMLQNNNYYADIIVAFDENGDGKLSHKELQLNDDKKIAAVKKRLQERGFQNPQIAGEVNDYRLKHGVVSAGFMQMDCQSCHGKGNRLKTDVALSSYTPGGITPTLALHSSQTKGKLVKTSGGLVLQRNDQIKGRYIFGTSHNTWITKLGFLFFVLSVLGVGAHGGLRIFFSKKYQAHHGKVHREYMYTFYERLWHWTMAGSILLLIVTGFEIHFSGNFVLFGLLNTVIIHNVLGFLVAINAFFSLFYHIATGEILQYFSISRNFTKETISQIFFYTYGIFKGEQHPVQKRKYRKTNPLQQVTYVVLLNILLPFQIITGILIWSIERSETLSVALNGLTYIAPMHSFASWLLLSFVVVHVYLTTTGHTPTANIQAMITGYDMVEETDKEFMHEQHELMKKGSRAMLQYYIEQFKDSYNRHFGKNGGKK